MIICDQLVIITPTNRLDTSSTLKNYYSPI